MIKTTEDIGARIRQTRKSLGITQKDLALTSGTGLRFIIDLEKGKPTCQIAKALTVLQTLGIKVQLHLPELDTRTAG
ncbi:MAG: type II toxin-antitoxin system Y4mF family antitoxin [Pseudomonadales bacterium]